MSSILNDKNIKYQISTKSFYAYTDVLDKSYYNKEYLNMNGDVSGEYLDYGYMGISVNSNQLLPGDIVVYHTNGIGSHVGIYIGNGLMIHAGTQQTGIVIVPMYDGYRTYNRVIY